jgi:hypothetical protein
MQRRQRRAREPQPLAVSGSRNRFWLSAADGSGSASQVADGPHLDLVAEDLVHLATVCRDASAGPGAPPRRRPSGRLPALAPAPHLARESALSEAPLGSL